MSQSRLAWHFGGVTRNSHFVGFFEFCCGYIKLNVRISIIAVNQWKILTDEMDDFISINLLMLLHNHFCCWAPQRCASFYPRICWPFVLGDNKYCWLQCIPAFFKRIGAVQVFGLVFVWLILFLWGLFVGDFVCWGLRVLLFFWVLVLVFFF